MDLNYAPEDLAFRETTRRWFATNTPKDNLKTLDEVHRNSLDYYATIRSLYRQVRNDAINYGAPGDAQAFPGLVGNPDGLDSGRTLSEVN